MADRTKGTVFTEYGSFYLVPGLEFPLGGWPQSLTTGLVSARGEEVRITTGTRTGEVPLTTETLDREPPLEPGWEDVAEVSVAVPSGGLRVLESRHPFLFGDVAAFGPGDYRVRVYANNRGDERAGRGSGDSFLLQLWQAPMAEEKLIRLCEESRHGLEAAKRLAGEPLPDLPRPPRSDPRPEPRPMSAPGGPRVAHLQGALPEPTTPPADND
ncbi:hypothetical protein [Embleya sp. NBC_00896]|uniref:hypothetical protein n=1 Tax=Embleya sp. NBC_00896 TaxID=2975961 RepID=UPI002F90AA54|nr:hypothetical protein OG928_46515 [Embleya sp. NBC_00896]